jgi:hypothetical protein
MIKIKITQSNRLKIAGLGLSALCSVSCGPKDKGTTNPVPTPQDTPQEVPETVVPPVTTAAKNLINELKADSVNKNHVLLEAGKNDFKGKLSIVDFNKGEQGPGIYYIEDEKLLVNLKSTKPAGFYPGVGYIGGLDTEYAEETHSKWQSVVDEVIDKLPQSVFKTLISSEKNNLKIVFNDMFKFAFFDGLKAGDIVLILQSLTSVKLSADKKAGEGFKHGDQILDSTRTAWKVLDAAQENKKFTKASTLVELIDYLKYDGRTMFATKLQAESLVSIFESYKDYKAATPPAGVHCILNNSRISYFVKLTATKATGTDGVGLMWGFGPETDWSPIK